jgi:hypothetical protein
VYQWYSIESQKKTKPNIFIAFLIWNACCILDFLDWSVSLTDELYIFIVQICGALMLYNIFICSILEFIDDQKWNYVKQIFMNCILSRIQIFFLLSSYHESIGFMHRKSNLQVLNKLGLFIVRHRLESEFVSTWDR